MEEPNPSGICQCGCGQPAPLARQTNRRFGHVGGKPVRFIRGHVGNLKRRDRLGPELWTVEDRGYETPCWVWKGTPRRTGYGRVKFQGRVQLPHRSVYEQEVGPIPEGLDLDHLCRVRLCVNPTHLEPVARAVNIRRGMGTKLTSADVELIRAATLSSTQIGGLLGVSPATVRDIRAGRTWVK